APALSSSKYLGTLAAARRGCRKRHRARVVSQCQNAIIAEVLLLTRCDGQIHLERRDSSDERIFSTNQAASGAEASHRKPESSAASGSYTEIRNSAKSLAGKISVRVARAENFKRCCMLTGRYDGAMRDNYSR